MPLIPLISPYKEKPSSLTRPNRNHPQLRGCVLWVCVWNGILFDLIKEKHQTRIEVNTDLTFDGNDVFFNGSGSTIYERLDLTLNSADFDDEGTVVCYLKNDPLQGTTSTYRTGIWDLGTAQDDLYPYTNSNIYLSAFRNDRPNLGNIGIDKTKWHQMAITQAPGANNWKFYQNAVQYYSTTGETTVSLPTTSAFGGKGTSRGYIGHLRDLRIYNRALSQQELQAILEDPWAPFEHRIWVRVSAAVGPTIIERTVTDSVDVADQQDRYAIFQRWLLNNLDLADLLARSPIVYRQVSDKINIPPTWPPGAESDLIYRYLERGRVISDQVDVTDLIRRYIEYFRVLSDNLDLLDSITREIQEAGKVIFTRNLTDNVDLEDSQVRYLQLYRLLEDNADLEDLISRVIRSPFTERILRDNVDLTDLVRREIISLVLGRIIYALTREPIVTDIETTGIITDIEKV